MAFFAKNREIGLMLDVKGRAKIGSFSRFLPDSPILFRGEYYILKEYMLNPDFADMRKVGVIWINL